MNQRWLHRRPLYRPSGEVIRTSEYDIAAIEGDSEARAFVETYHYSQSYPAARFRFGLYHKGELAGVAVFTVPCSDAVLTNVFPGAPYDSVELGRFVLLDRVPSNGETWFLARCFNALRGVGLAGVVAFSDPLPRRTLHGAIIHKGHIGTICQASTGVYLGRRKPRRVRLLPDASIPNERTIHKIRNRERGWKNTLRSSSTLEHGYPVAWLEEWLRKLTRSIRHPGNHKYAWALHRTIRKALPISLPFPKGDPLFYLNELNK